MADSTVTQSIETEQMIICLFSHGQLNTWTCNKNESQAISGPPLQKRCFRKIAIKTKVFVVKTKVKHHSNA